MRITLASCLLFFASLVQANGGTGTMGPYAMDSALLQELLAAAPQDGEVRKENTRLVAALLALTLGPFGAHRLYLGTVPKVAIIYGVTFGGFGVLAVIDLVHILCTKDLTPYRNNDKVFMWAGERRALTPP
jgi:TM2 domain-containing membrane protein YozV